MREVFPSENKTIYYSVVCCVGGRLATGYHTRGQEYSIQSVTLKVRDVKEELRNMRLEAHTKQLTKELKSARTALEQERKLRKVQGDTIKVLWREIQALQVEQESGHDRRLEREKRRLTEKKLARVEVFSH